MKEQIKNWFIFDRTFNTGIQIYYKYGRNKAFINSFNINGNTTQNYQSLLEGLRLLAGINMIEFNKLIKQPLKKKENPKRRKKQIIANN